MITTQPANETLAPGETVNLSVSVTGDAPLSYQWLKDGAMMVGATNNTLTITNAGMTNSGVYYVVVQNTNGLGISVPALVSVGNPDLLAWGGDYTGQLGDGSAAFGLTRPLPEVVASNAVTAVAGDFHSLFIKNDGTLWGMGDNWSGELGDGTGNNQSLPECVASNVVTAAAGVVHSLFVKSDGTLWAMGANDLGQLGDGTTIYQHLPELITNNVVAVAAGELHSAFLKNDGTVWAMGNGYGNQPEFVASNVVALSAREMQTLLLVSDGTLWETDEGYWTQPAFVASNVVAMAARGYQTLVFLERDGTLWGNTFNQSNAVVVIGGTNAVGVTAGDLHTVFWKRDGTLWAMGDNRFGELGDGTYNSRTVPELVGGMLVANASAAGDGAMGGIADTLAVGLPQAPGATGQPVNQMVVSGGSISFTSTVVGIVPLSYQWFLNGLPLADNGNITGSMSSVLALSVVATNQAGNYTVVVTNLYGSVTNNVVVLTVLSLPGGAPIFTSVTPNNDGSLTMILASIPNSTNWIEATTNLVNPVWEMINTNVAGADGFWNYIDSDVVNFPQRFYRVYNP